MGRPAYRSAVVSLAIALLTVSDTRTLADDRSGDALQQRLQAAGHRLHERAIVPDNRYRIRAELSRWIADPALQGELFRVLSFESIGTSTLQSRCLAGVANGTVIFVLPGSLDAVETAWDRLISAQLNQATRPCNLVQLLPRLTEPAG